MKQNPLNLGVYPEMYGKQKGIWISMKAKSEDCGIILYDLKTGEEKAKYSLPKENVIGEVHYGYIENVDVKKVSYLLFDGETILVDESAKEFVKSGEFKDKRSILDMKALFVTDDFDWEGDECPKLPYEDVILYGLHVRGFTMHASSKVKGKGTFQGITEKIPYLKELGITTLELQPAYEFLTLPLKEEVNKKMVIVDDKINYWGYTKGFYYAPKKDYAYKNNAGAEFKALVKELHKNGQELVMQFFFPEDFPKSEVLKILRFWKYEYHVDGFRLMGNNLPVYEIKEDPYLSDSKLFYYDFDIPYQYGSGNAPAKHTIAAYNDDYMYTMRRFLKGDEGMLRSVAEAMRRNPNGKGFINYLSNFSTFTMQDMVSYDRKHNEENKEENRDGSDYNCSWNCGAEGTTKKNSILSLRKRQVRNAFLLLMLSQGTPFIFMGDEFGNSQLGNNNPYCQDNEIAWLNWKDLSKNKDLFEYVKEMTAFRKKNRILHMSKEVRIMDYRSCGYPDISYHGRDAWKQDFEAFNRHVAMMYCNSYAEEEGFWHIAINMHWEAQEVALPRLPQNGEWSLYLSTKKANAFDVDIMKLMDKLTIPPRTIMICRGE